MNGKEFIQACKDDLCYTQSRSSNGVKYHNKYTELLGSMGYDGINKKGVFTKRYAYGVVGHCCIGVQYHFIKGGLSAFVPKSKGYIWNTNQYRKWLMTEPTIKGYGKVDFVTDHKKAVAGAVAFKGDGKNKKSATHTCVYIKSKGDYVYTVDFNVGDGHGHNNGTVHKRHKKYFLGFANMPYPKEEEHVISKIEVSKDEPHKAVFGMKYLRITATPTSTAAHRACKLDYPVDLAGNPKKTRDWWYNKTGERLVVLRRYPKASNMMIVRTKHKVVIPLHGSKKPVYLYMMVEHQDAGEMKVPNTSYLPDSRVVREGHNSGSGKVGDHLHVSFGWSDKRITYKTIGSGWKSSPGWSFYHPDIHRIKIEDALYVDPEFTKILDTKGIKFTTL